MGREKTPLYIFDLDGTIALVDHRRHLVQAPKCADCNGSGKSPGYTAGDSKCMEHCDTCDGSGKTPNFKPDWNGFWVACVDDEPNWPVIRVMNALFDAGYEIAIWSGRDDCVRRHTLDWLSEHIEFLSRDQLAFALRMRPNGDFTPDERLKGEWLATMKPEDRERLVGVFDDRDKVVAMWRYQGIPCFQVAPGDF